MTLVYRLGFFLRKSNDYEEDELIDLFGYRPSLHRNMLYGKDDYK